MFDSTKRSLRELLQELRKGTIQLPEFQRGWVWKNEQIKELIAVEGMQSAGEEGLPQLDKDDETTAALEEIDA